MQKIILTVGIPGSGKSTWAKAEVAKDPNAWCRVNNDDLRAMFNGSVYSPDYEKFVTEARNFVIREALKRKKNVIIDNLNLNRRHFDDVVKIAKEINGTFQVFEKPFYIELEEAIERDSKREGKAKVGEEVIKKWWKESGGKGHKFYNPRSEFIQGQELTVEPPAYDPNLPDAIVCDLDGTLALMNGRSPYDASTCDKDLPNWPVIQTVLAHYEQGRKIIFCSGREDKYREPTITFIETYVRAPLFQPDNQMKGGRSNAVMPIPYELHMRKADDMRKDAIIKEEIYDAHIKDKYNVLLVLDDRNQVVDFWRSKGLTCFQVAPGNF